MCCVCSVIAVRCGANETNETTVIMMVIMMVVSILVVTSDM